jgi:heat shock protein HtpX
MDDGGRKTPSARETGRSAPKSTTFQPTSPAALTRRAAQAIALSIGFYVTALGLAGLFIYIPVAEASCTHDGSPPQLLILWLAAGAILWSLLPRPDRAATRGTLLGAEQQPELFAVIDHVAQAVRQSRPNEVYLVPDLNAWVSSRGGVLGVGIHRTMGIGLPLLQELTVSQLQGVLAHEFGHYYNGDVKLGPWIYQTRAAMGRVVSTLARSGSLVLHIVHQPFVWYGEFFLRFTQAISRHQELDADSLAARTVGCECFASGLKALHAGGVAFEMYWRGLVAPALASGVRFPLASGFAQFRSFPGLADRLEALVDRSSHSAAGANPYDSHPPLGERLARVEALPETGAVLPTDLRPAIELIRDLEGVETKLLEAIAPSPEAFRALRTIPWAEAVTRASLEAWTHTTAQARVALADMTAATVPTDLAGLSALGRRIRRSRVLGEPLEESALVAARVVAAATACNLVAAGWRLEALPGQPAVLRKGDAELRPHAVLRGLVQGTAQPIDWQGLHTTGGISDVPLATAGRGSERNPIIPPTIENHRGRRSSRRG